MHLVGRNVSSDNAGTGHLSKVTSSKLKKIIQPMLVQLVGHTLHTDNGGTARLSKST